MSTMSASSGLRLGDYIDVDAEFLAFFNPDEPAWEPLSRLEAIAQALGERDGLSPRLGPTGARIFIHPDARVEPFAHIVGPAYIGAGVELRHTAYIREAVVLLPGSTIGHGTEIKNSVLFPGAAVPHLSYVGDSVLGHQVNLGAGTILSNLPIMHQASIEIPFDGAHIDTGRRKFGAVLGDGTSIGCNAVVNPGVLLGADSDVYPLVSVRKGVYPPHAIFKATGTDPIVKREYAPS